MGSGWLGPERQITLIWMVVAAHRTSVGCAQAGQRAFSPDSTITRRDVIRWRDFYRSPGEV